MLASMPVILLDNANVTSAAKKTLRAAVNDAKAKQAAGTLTTADVTALTEAIAVAEKATKKANPIKVEVKKKCFTAKKGKKTVIKETKAFKITKRKSKVNFKLSSAKRGSKSFKKNFTVSKTGKITVKKGLKKGTYKIRVKVTAAGNGTYKKGVRNVTLKIRVR